MEDNKHDNGKQLKSNIFNEFFWICSGVNRTILRQCPTEYSKYFGIGGTIFFTALMASLSGGYAFFTIFNSIALAIIFGIFWGLLIFNLDRFIVNTMYSDGKYSISLMEFLSGLPRLIIAVFLGIVISTPLEMKIFEDRINSQIIKDNAVRTTETQKIKNKEYLKLSKLEDELKHLYDKRATLDNKLLIAKEDLKKEVEGTSLSGKVGKGQIYEEKEKFAKECELALDRWNKENKTTIDILKKEIEDLKNQIDKFQCDISEGMEQEGFCVRYEAFNNIKKEVPAVNIVSIFIMLLFIIIEVCPTLFKMMIASGPYDELLSAEMKKKKVLAIKTVSDLNDEINSEVNISYEINKYKTEQELILQKEFIDKSIQAKREIMQKAILKCKKDELSKYKDHIE